ncbi:MAG: hypothetical protein U0T84_09940 [Chitinophagales bacterium]
MIKKIRHVLAGILLATSASAQVGQVVDSINLLKGNNDALYATGIAFHNGGFWISGSQMPVSRLYKVNMAGQRIDSISYRNAGGAYPHEALYAEGNFLYATRFGDDSLKKYDLTTKQEVARYAIGGSDIFNEEFLGMASNGDTLFLFGAVSGTRAIFLKSSGQVKPWSITTTVAPLGLFHLPGNQFFVTERTAATADRCYRIDRASLSVITGTIQNWCLKDAYGLTTDGQYFYQVGFSTNKIYKIQTNILTPNAVEDLASPVFQLMPQPAVNMLKIRTGDVMDAISVTDLTGRELRRMENPIRADESYEIQLNDFNQGTYVVTGFSGLNSWSRIFVKE